VDLYPIAIPTKQADNLSMNVDPAAGGDAGEAPAVAVAGGVVCGVCFVVAVSK
jgi:hypothetical protein